MGTQIPSDRYAAMGFQCQDGFTGDVDSSLANELPPTFLNQNRIVPLQRLAGGEILVGVVSPSACVALDALAVVLKAPLRLVILPASEIRRLLLRRSGELRKSAAEILLGAEAGDGDTNREDLLDGSNAQALTIQLVNSFIGEAVERRASDIHIEPERQGIRVRYRVDGLLQDAVNPPADMKEYIVSRIKIMAKMDVTQRREPQDGSMQVQFGGEPVDIRISTVPTPFGERVVMRLLGGNRELADLARLGVPPEMAAALREIWLLPKGLFIVAGPTGSGKTTTLYAALRQIDVAQRNVMTIEDPVEYEIPGISQVQAGGRQGLTFAAGLRSLLRQDPDVMMVGEIRDGETAQIALRSALTGHLILTTIHSDSAAAAVIRLLDLGSDAALIAETLTAILDQRLIRTCCKTCAGVGCDACHGTGFAGRRGLFRLVAVDDTLRQLIRASDHDRIRQVMADRHGEAFDQQIRELISKGVTTVKECRRVLPGASKWGV